MAHLQIFCLRSSLLLSSFGGLTNALHRITIRLRL